MGARAGWRVRAIAMWTAMAMGMLTKTLTIASAGVYATNGGLKMIDPETELAGYLAMCRAMHRSQVAPVPRFVHAVAALADKLDEAEQSRDLNHAAAKMALDQRDEALQALKMLCDHHYTYAGADADTANDHGLYAKVKTARAALAALLKGGATHDSTAGQS